jgi:acyl-CoA dehydrogenase
MGDFSMELNEDQTTLRDWVHGFAETQMRPIAAEWDEREETPWPFIQEAAKLGVYGLDFMMNAIRDPTGLSMMIALEELAWGDAGLCMSIMGTTLGVAAIVSNGTPEQQMEWVPQCYGTLDDIKLAAFGVSEPDAGSDVSSLRTRAIYDEAKDEWILNGTKTWITNGGIANVHVIVLVVGAKRRSSCQREHRASAWDRSSRKWVSARVIPPK